MIFEQKCRLPVPIGMLWEFMVDTPQVSACVPGLEEFSETGQDRYSGRVRIKVGPISLRMQGNLTVARAGPELLDRAHDAEGRDHRIAGGVKAILTVTLAAIDANETEFSVHADTAIFGKLGEFGQPIMKRSAERVLRQFVENIVGRLSAHGLQNKGEEDFAIHAQGCSFGRRRDDLLYRGR